MPSATKKTKEKVEKVEEPVVEKVEGTETKEAEIKEEDVKMEEKEEEKPKDVEIDAKEDSRPKISHTVAMNSSDALANTCVSDETILFPVQIGNIQNLFCAARANTGIKGGRYYYEVRVAEQKQGCTLFAGFGTAKADLLGGEGTYLFNGRDGSFSNSEEKGKPAGTKTKAWNDVIGILLNMDCTSENFFNIELFY